MATAIRSEVVEPTDQLLSGEDIRRVYGRVIQFCFFEAAIIGTIPAKKCTG